MFSIQSTPTAVRNLKIASNCLMLIIIILAFVDYFVNIAELKDLKSNLILIHNSHSMNADVNRIVISIY